ncbi:hypothetical protein BDN70DRAFT_883393 [Pholiota conissans]|uniref:Uncharacterized protein n=1 Tax=Pholiota conissans TaxID=109636 RepID=A0A9P5YW74_9AGAR|nr:hypothetical protein BDN70DRAFT_883393 [Pholiota conissans]
MRFETALNPIWVDIIHENYTALIWSRHGSRISSPVVKSDQPRSTQWIQIRSTAENRETLGDALITIMDKFPKYDFRTEKCANEAISEMEGLLGPITTSDVWSKEKDG